MRSTPTLLVHLGKQQEINITKKLLRTPKNYGLKLTLCRQQLTFRAFGAFGGLIGGKPVSQCGGVGALSLLAQLQLDTALTELDIRDLGGTGVG